jgi:hypothetical protein
MAGPLLAPTGPYWKKNVENTERMETLSPSLSPSEGERVADRSGGEFALPTRVD